MGLIHALRNRDRSWREGRLAHAGRVLLALGAVPIAVAQLHRARAWETPLVAVGAAVIAAGMVCMLGARRRHREANTSRGRRDG